MYVYVGRYDLEAYLPTCVSQARVIFIIIFYFNNYVHTWRGSGVEGGGGGLDT